MWDLCFAVVYCIRDCCDCDQFDRDLVDQWLECRIKEAVSHCGKIILQSSKKFNNMYYIGEVWDLSDKIHLILFYA